MRSSSISRRKILIVLIALIGVIAMIALTACSQSEPQFDLVKNNGEYGDMVLGNMQYLAENYPDRTMSTQGELNTAKYLSSRLSDLGYTSEYSYDEIIGLQHFKVDFMRYDGSPVSDPNAYNVIFTKKAVESKGEIVLSAQYDNLYEEKAGGETWKADGSYESGSGSAVLLALAEIMSTVDYSYDITFAFFSGGCYGWQGAEHYVNHLKNAEIENIKLNVNFSMLGGGDGLYLYTGENVSDYGGYIRSACDGLASNPKDKNVATFVMDSDATYSYTHIGMLGNQYCFINKNVPIANFMSINWSCNDDPFVTEMKGKANVYHTADDTLEMMIGRKGEDNVKVMLNNVVNGALNALSEENAEQRDSALATARQQIASKGQNTQASSMTTIALKLIAVAVFFGISLTVRNYVRKNRSLYVKEQPKQEEIKPFDFDSYPKSGEDVGSDNDSDFIDNDGQNPPDDPFL
ncbi:MAG: M28 family peptidase [Clostridia bacterium]|nr:M28 family peptidase [Clostridia bacterium]